MQPSTGCWIDGHWGQYGIARLVEIAQTYGYENMDVITLAEKHMARAPMTDNDWEILMDSADSVEDWLNTNVAQPGLRFGWSDGEFFLMDDDWWQKEA